jgi:hypothetical protein
MHILTLRANISLNYLCKVLSLPRSEHSFSVTKTSQFMLLREIMTVCSEIHIKHINTLCGQKVK